MKIQAILDRKGGDVVTVEPEMRIPTAAGRMRLKNIASLVVMKGGRMVGIVSERDIVAAVTRFGADLSHLSVARIMTDPVICAPQDDYKHVMRLMTTRRTRHLPVIEQGRLVGIVSIGDVVKHRLEELELETAVQRDVYLAHH